MRAACIDLEGVLIPELWPYIAQATGVQELAVTTREEPDYARLVARRIAILRREGLSLFDVRQIVSELAPLEGAEQFLFDLDRRGLRIILVSDAFAEMIQPLWQQLGRPELRCHRFASDSRGFIEGAQYVRTCGKHEEIERLHDQGAWTLAVGDAFNDLSMLRKASLGLLFRPSLQTAQAAPDLAVVESYEQVIALLKKGDRAGQHMDCIRQTFDTDARAISESMTSRLHAAIR